jgi:hypothetical protein
MIDEEEIAERLAELEQMVEEKFVKDGDINLYDLNVALQHSMDNQDGKGPFLGGGFLAGWRDSNKSFNPADMVGRTYDAGIYSEMRYSSDVIAPIMDSIASMVASMEYQIVPRVDEPTDDQIVAAKAVSWAMNNMPNLSLNRFISKSWDNEWTYGFSLWEMMYPKDGKDAGRFGLSQIAPWMVEWWDLNDERSALDGVRVNVGDGTVDVPAAKVAWFGSQNFEGNYWANSHLRPVVAVYAAYKEDLKNYLALRRLQKGVLVAQETSAGSNTASWNAVKAWLKRHYAGQSLPLLLNEGMKLEYIAVQQPGLDTYNNMLSYWDSKMRTALDDGLGNLGIDGVGSLALGQEVSDVSKSRLVAKINLFLENLNGNTNPDSCVLQVVTELLGFNPHTDTPMIVAVDNVEADQSENAQIMAGWLKDGVVSRAELGDDNLKAMIESMGFSTEHLEKEDE